MGCKSRARVRLFLCVLISVTLYVLRDAADVPASVRPLRVDASPPTCPASLGRGASPYRSLGSAASPCAVVHDAGGRTGNQLVTYFVGRLYAELHGCASSRVDFGADMGAEAALRGDAAAWPPARDLPAPTLVERGDGLRELFEGGGTRALTVRAQFERADIIYAAASLGWDLGHETLAGVPWGVERAHAALDSTAVRARAALWSAQRESCAVQAGVGGARALHPWLPAGARALAISALEGRGLPADSPAGLRAVAADADGTLVIHARLGDMAAMAWQESEAAFAGGHPGRTGSAVGGSVGWDWAPERFPGYKYPKFPDCEKLRDEPAYHSRDGGDMLDALEFDVARLGGFVVSPLSFYEELLRALSPRPRNIVVLTEPCAADHPVVRALERDWGAIVQTSTVAADFATMLLARELVISSSTFSYMAAVLGRARAVHAPYAGSFSLVRAHNRQCLPPAPGLDARFIFHDVYRRAVDKTAAALRARAQPHSGYVWSSAADGASAVPERPAACPLAPTGFLTFDQLADFYRNPACANYYYPPRDAAEERAVEDAVRATGRAPICTDVAWTFYKD